MEITIESSKSVKPACASPATVQVVPLTVLDKATFETYVSTIYAFHPPAPSNAILEAGLAEALVDYREWAGRLDGDRCAILLTDAGARFVAATAAVALDTIMPLRPTPELLKLHPSRDGGDGELMLIQATRFACGSLVVGITAHHKVADGGGMCKFILAWGRATRGASVPRSPPLLHERPSVFAPRSPLRIEFEHRGVEYKPRADRDSAVHRIAGGSDDEVLVERVHFSLELIAKLKSLASAGTADTYSSFQCVVAHLWRRITAARGGGLDATNMYIAVDGRARMSLRVPDGYTGNVVLWARPSATARELLGKPLQHAAELIRQAVALVDDAYFKSFVDFASSGVVEEEGLVSTADAALHPAVEVYSWLRIPFYDLDLGGGRPCFFMPSYMKPVEGVVILAPSVFGDGSLDAYVPIFSRDANAFNNHNVTWRAKRRHAFATIVHALRKCESSGRALPVIQDLAALLSRADVFLQPDARLHRAAGAEFEFGGGFLRSTSCVSSQLLPSLTRDIFSSACTNRK